MKSQIELDMERTQATVRRLRKELEVAQDEADVAWRRYVHEPKKDIISRWGPNTPISSPASA